MVTKKNASHNSLGTNSPSLILSQIKRYLSTLILLAVIGIVYYLSGFSAVKIEMESTVPSYLQVFWSTDALDDIEFAAENSKATATVSGKKDYWFIFKNGEDISRFRIDPTSEKTTIAIHNVTLYTSQYLPINVDLFKYFFRVNEINLLPSSSAEEGRVEIVSLGNDPQIRTTALEYQLPYISIVLWILSVVYVIHRYGYLLGIFLQTPMMQPISHWVAANQFFSIYLALLVLLYYLSGFSLLKVEMDSAVDSKMEVFWDDDHKGIDEDVSKLRSTVEGRENYWFFIKNKQDISRFRFDLTKEKTTLKLYDIVLYTTQYLPIHVDYSEENLSRIDDLDIVDPILGQTSYAEMTALSKDPQIRTRGIEYPSPVISMVIFMLFTAYLLYRYSYVFYAIPKKVIESPLGQWVLRNRPLFPLFYSVLLAGLFLYFASFTLVRVELGSSAESELQIYWSEDNVFARDDSEIKETVEGKSSYWFLIDGNQRNSRFRLDPAKTKANIKIYGIDIYSTQYFPAEVSVLENELKFDEIDVIASDHSNNKPLEFVTLGIDPSIETKTAEYSPPLIAIVFYTLLAAYLFYHYGYLRHALWQKITSHAAYQWILKRKRFLPLIFLAFAVVLFNYLSTFALLKVDLSSEARSELQVYWGEIDEEFSIKHSTTVSTRKGQHSYWFLIKEYKTYPRFRIDPAAEKTAVKFHEVKLYSAQYLPIAVDFRDDFVEMEEVETGRQTLSEQAYSDFITIDNDPHIYTKTIKYSPYHTSIGYLILILSFLCFSQQLLSPFTPARLKPYLLSFWDRYLRSFLFALHFVMAVGFVAYLTTFAVVNVEMDLEEASEVQVYWAGEDRTFYQQNSRITKTQTGRHNYWTVIKDYKKFPYLRVDPTNKNETNLKLYGTTLYSMQGSPIDIDLLKEQINAGGMEKPTADSIHETYVDIKTDHKDPFAEVGPLQYGFPYGLTACFILLIGFIVFVVSFILPHYQHVAGVADRKASQYPQWAWLLNAKYIMLSVLLFASLTSLGYLSTFALLKVDMDVSEDSVLEVYWSYEDRNPTDDTTKTIKTKEGRHAYWFVVEDYKKFTYFRVDHSKFEGEVKLYETKLYSIPFYPLNLSLLNDVTESEGMEDIVPPTYDNDYTEFLATTDDPTVDIYPVQTRSFYYIGFLILAIASIFPRKYYYHAGVLFSGALILYYSLSFNEATISFNVEADRAGEIKVFWRNQEEKLSHVKVKKVEIEQGSHSYQVHAGNTSNMDFVYLDSGEYWPYLDIDDIRLTEIGYVDLTIEYAKSGLDKYGNISKLPKLIVSVGIFFVLFLFIVGCLFYLTSQKIRLFRKIFPRVVKVLFLFAALLVADLAWQADLDIHPDENAHIASVDYYTDYWDPPVIGDSRALDAYQFPWAVSRLDDLGISYFFAGKFKNVIQIFFENETFTSRAFNVLLFILFFIFIQNKRLLLFLTPLICTPQIWYLYSYANRGGFVLFISILLAWQLVNKKSHLNIFLQEGRKLSDWKYILFPSLLLGILSIEQTNYVLFIMFVFTLLLWELLFFIQDKKIFFYKCTLFFLAGLSIYGVRYAADVSINGTGKQAQRVAYAEENAEDDFKPSIASTEDSYSGLRLRDKGVKFVELFNPKWNWHKMSFKSFTGLYGYYKEFSPKWYYSYVTLIYVIIILLALRHAIFRADWQHKLFAVVTFTAICGGLFVSMLFSWLYDFQPQGRYSFPIIPIILVFFWKMFPLWNKYEKAIMLSSVLVLSLLSFYSFHEVALNYLVP